MNSKKIHGPEVLYLLYFAILSFIKGLGFYEGQKPFTIAMVLALLLVALKILCTEHTVREYLLIMILAAMALLVYHNNGEKVLLLYVTMMVGIKGVSMHRVFVTGALAWGCSTAIITFLTTFGLASETCLIHPKHGLGYVFCHAMGYSHPNVTHTNYLVLCMFIMYLYCKKYGNSRKHGLLRVTGVLMLGNLFIFLGTVSYTGVAIVTIYLILNLYFCLRPEITAGEKGLLELILPACILFSIAGPVLITGRLFDIINKILNTRYNLSRYFLTEQPLSLFGVRLVIPDYHYSIDCSYVYLLMYYGLIPFVLIMLAMLLVIHRSLARGRRVETAIILGLCIAGISEPFVFNSSYRNLAFLFIGEMIYEVLAERKVKTSAAILDRTIRIVPADPEISVGWAGKVLSAIRAGLDTLHRNFGRVFAVFAASTAVCFAVLCLVTAKPSVIYIDAWSDTDPDQQEEIYISEADVAAARSDGDLVMGYTGPEDPMIAYKGQAVTLEFYRMNLYRAFFIGSAAAAAAVVVITLRKRSES